MFLNCLSKDCIVVFSVLRTTTRIPEEFELPGSKAVISRDGDRLIMEPARKKGMAALLDSWEPLDEKFPEVDDPLPAPKDIL